MKVKENYYFYDCFTFRIEFYFVLRHTLYGDLILTKLKSAPYSQHTQLCLQHLMLWSPCEEFFAILTTKGIQGTKGKQGEDFHLEKTHSEAFVNPK